MNDDLFSREPSNAVDLAERHLGAPTSRREFWARQITAAWQSSVDGIVRTGENLISAKKELPGEFETMVESDLPFGPRAARMLMAIPPWIEEHRNHGSVLPPSWRTIYELTRLPAPKFQALLAAGKIHPEMERKDIVREPRADPAAQRGQPERDGPDFWPTPASLVTALVRYVIPDLPAGAIWECAAGDGRLVKAIVAAGRRVIASDRYPQDGGDPIDFMDDPPAETQGSIVVTNPPYNQSEEFLARGLELLDDGRITGLVLLLRHDHLMAGSRVEIFNQAVREVHCNWRPIWIDDTDGNPRWSFHWLIWHAGPRQAPLYLDEASVAALQEAAE